MLEKPFKLHLMFNSHRLLILVLILSNQSQRLFWIRLKQLALPFHAMVSSLILSAHHLKMKLQALDSQLDLKVKPQVKELPLLLVTFLVSKDSLKMTELISLSSSEKSSMKTKIERSFFLVLPPQPKMNLRSATPLTTQI